MTAPTRLVRVPALTTRSGWRWMIATVVAVLVIGVVVLVTQPENRVFVVTVLPGLALFLTVLVWQSTWVDPVAGAVVRMRCRVWRREVRLGPGASVALVPDGGGSLLVAVTPELGRRLFVHVLSRTDYGERSQSPELLRVISGTVEQHRAGGARPVAEALRLQAEHLESGGPVATSPLAALLTYGTLRAAKAAAAVSLPPHLP